MRRVRHKHVMGLCNRETRRRVVRAIVSVGLAIAVGHAVAGGKHRDDVLQGLDCNACHSTEGWPLSNAAGAAGGFDHSRTGFPLTAEHGKVLCTSCHQPKKTGVSRDCVSCHPDRHRGKLGLQCDSCHNASSWQETQASRRHRLTRLPLTGMHAVLDCTSCHLRRNDRQFQPVPADCFACHDDDYRRDIHPLHRGDPANGVPPFSRRCEACHQSSSWSPAFINPSAQLAALQTVPPRHDQAFVLSRGSHKNSACSTCHRSQSTSKIVNCNGCHEHSASRLRAQHKQPVSSAAFGCLGCHPRGLLR